MLGMEDNPFGLFLILILLLGATGYFDPAPKNDVQATGESDQKPASALPVWQTRPKEKSLVKPFSGARQTRQAPKADLLTAIFEMLGLPKPKKALALLRKVLTPRQSRHPLLQLRHKMLQ
jgi:hypothetical protein